MIFLIFFYFHQIHKSEYALDVGRAFYAYLSETDTEVFTTSDPDDIYEGIIDYRIYFLVHANGYVTRLRNENHLNIYITKTFGTILKRTTILRFSIPC